MEFEPPQPDSSRIKTAKTGLTSDSGHMYFTLNTALFIRVNVNIKLYTDVRWILRQYKIKID